MDMNLARTADRLIRIAAVALTLAACSDMSQTQQRRLSSTAGGAAGGAVIGAIAGNAGTLGLVVGHERSVLNHVPPDGNPPYMSSVGDEDEGCLEPNLMLKRTIPSSGLAVLPRTGHTCNLEEPEAFNRLLERFFADVEHDAWGLRDPRSLATSTTGMDER